MSRCASRFSSGGARMWSSRCVRKNPGMAHDTCSPVPANSPASVSLSEITPALVTL